MESTPQAARSLRKLRKGFADVSTSVDSNYLKDSLSRRVLFFTGKGGVGKTTLALATALACHRHGKKVIVVNWSPYHDTDSPIGQRFLAEGIDWLHLNTFSAFREYALTIVKFEKVYDLVFENPILRSFIAAAPGLSESVIGGKLWDLFKKDEYDLIIVDLPSSGHALSFLQSPFGLQKIFRFGFVRRDVNHVVDLFTSKDSRIDLIAQPEDLPIEECQQLKNKLLDVAAFPIGYLHMNLLTPDFGIPKMDAKQLENELEQYYARYSGQLDQEKTKIDLAGQLKLPMVLSERFACKKMSDSIVSLSKHLEEAHTTEVTS